MEFQGRKPKARMLLFNHATFQLLYHWLFCFEYPFLAGVVSALDAAGFRGHTTLEIAGEAAVLASLDYLQQL